MPAKPVVFKERTSRRALRAARKEGFIVTGQEVLKDGTFRLSFAEPSGKKSHDSELDEWLGEHPDAGQTQGHQ